MQFVKKSALVAACILAAGSHAAAQQITSPFHYVEERQSLGPYVAHVGTDRGTLGIGAHSGTLYGLRYDLHLSGPLMLEADLGYFPTNRTVFVVDSAATAEDSTGVPVLRNVGESDLGIISFLGALRFNITGQRTFHGLMPYLTIGGGGAFDITKDAPSDEVPATAVFNFGTTFAGSFGAGVEWFPTRRLAVRADLRDVLWKMANPEAFLSGTVARNEWVQNRVVSGGFAIHF